MKDYYHLIYNPYKGKDGVILQEFLTKEQADAIEGTANMIGDRGTTEDNLLKENFIKIGLSVTYDGIWFVKRKYD